jgi:hypothetical protein
MKFLGICESFIAETAHLGIKSLIVEPGYFRTSFLSPGAADLIPTKFADYEPITKGLFGAMDVYNGKQPGDPEKAVEIIIDMVKQEGVAAWREVPLRLALGPDAVAGIRKKCEDTLEMLKKWENVSSSTNFEEGK